MARRTIAHVAACGILFLAACRHAPTAGSKLGAVIDTVDGMPRLTYPGSGGPTLDWAMDTVAVIGKVMSTDEHYMLGQVPKDGVAGDAKGDLFVLDMAAHHVVSYDSAGSYLTTYGRQGNGPGELGAPYGLSLGPGDTVWVQGISTHRLTGFPVQGGEARTLTLSAEGFLAPPLAAVPGAFLTEGFPVTFFPGTRKSGDSTSVVPLASIKADGSSMDTIWSRPAPKPTMVRTQNAVLLFTPTFEPTLRWAVFPDGSVAVASDAGYTIHLLRPDGSEWMRLARDLPPRPVDDHDRQVARDRMRAGFAASGSQNPAQKQLMEKRLAAMIFAPTVPRITGVRVDDSDRLWVGVSLAQPDSTQRIDVFERDGTLLGSIEGMSLPVAFFGSDLAAALRKDPATDVQQVVVLRLREGGR